IRPSPTLSMRMVPMQNDSRPPRAVVFWPTSLPRSDTGASMTDTVARARAWLAQDPDPVTREELSALLARVEAGEEAAQVELADRFATRLAFEIGGAHV